MKGYTIVFGLFLVAQSFVSFSDGSQESLKDNQPPPQLASFFELLKNAVDVNYDLATKEESIIPVPDRDQQPKKNSESAIMSGWGPSSGRSSNSESAIMSGWGPSSGRSSNSESAIIPGWDQLPKRSPRIKFELWSTALANIANSADPPQTKKALSEAIAQLYNSVPHGEQVEQQSAPKFLSVRANKNAPEMMGCWPQWIPNWMLNEEEKVTRYQPPCVRRLLQASSVPMDSELGEELTEIGALYRRARSVINNSTALPSNIRGQLKMAMDGVFDKVVRDTQRSHELQAVRATVSDENVAKNVAQILSQSSN